MEILQCSYHGQNAAFWWFVNNGKHKHPENGKTGHMFGVLFLFVFGKRISEIGFGNNGANNIAFCQCFKVVFAGNRVSESF